MAKASSPEEGMASLIRNLEANTGKSIDAWIATAQATGQTKHGQIVAVLKKDHGLSHGYANQIALGRWQPRTFSRIGGGSDRRRLFRCEGRVFVRSTTR